MNGLNSPLSADAVKSAIREHSKPYEMGIEKNGSNSPISTESVERMTGEAGQPYGVEIGQQRQSDIALGRLAQIADRIDKIDEATRVKLAPLLIPDSPSCQNVDKAENRADSEFFTELLVKLNILDSRIDTLETTISRIEV